MSGSSGGGNCTTGTTTGPALSYGYDQNGRQVMRGATVFHGTSLFQLMLPSSVSQTAVNADNQLTEWNGTYNLYDANGNLTCSGSTSATACQGSGTQSFTWDTRNRLSAAAAAPALGGTAESYVYDGLSRRQSVTAPRPSCHTERPSRNVSGMIS